ncbi:hypothetical protein MPSEU_000126100 [Mayamaea pseudoterrestris]|nr:hypothetical protein MPSEU_000124800 [Mayamaea pseudoterrestris]GKY91540.1 hypothetical protein MPSEU_000126100 [Mayamaea pseudoterrestris]
MLRWNSAVLVLISLHQIQNGLAFTLASSFARPTWLHSHLESAEAPDDAEKQGAIRDIDVLSSEPIRTRELTPNEMMKALNTSPRRILLSGLASTTIALSANFLGVTSKILEAFPESAVEASGLEALYPRGNYKRFRGQGYTFLFPKEWVADSALELAKATRRTASLDYQMNKRRSSDAANNVVPDAALGPPGRLDGRGVSQADTNVSVVLSTLLPGFSLRGTLGTPTVAAETFLRVSLAPEGLGRTASLIDASEDESRQVYEFEYTIDRGDKGPPLRAISIIASMPGDTLLTLTVVAPVEAWATSDKKLRKIASSFHSTY